MYYNKVLSPCQPLLAGAVVAFKQHAAEEVQSPCLEQSDGLQPKQFRHEPVPQKHSWQGHDQAQANQEGYGCDESDDNVHFTLLS